MPFTTPGKDHTAHRLANLGLGQRGAVLLMYLLGAFGGGTAVLIGYLSTRGALYAGLVALAVILFGVAFLERAPYEKQVRKTASVV